MTVAAITAKKLAPGAFIYAWTGTPDYLLYIDGLLQDQTTLEDDTASFYVEGTDLFEPRALEIQDDDSTGNVQSVDYPPFVLLQWRSGDLDTEYYKIERYVSAAWTTVTYVAESNSRYYQYRTPALTDQTAEQYRITSINKQGNESPVKLFTFTPVTLPPIPVISVSYSDGTSNVTISART